MDSLVTAQDPVALGAGCCINIKCKNNLIYMPKNTRTKDRELHGFRKACEIEVIMDAVRLSTVLTKSEKTKFYEIIENVRKRLQLNAAAIIQ